MLYPKCGLGIVVNNISHTISIFDTECLRVLQNIPVSADVIDVTMNDECSRAAISSFYSKTMFQLDLRGEFATIVGSATTTTYLEDVSMSPDGRFAVSVDGSAGGQNIASYSLEGNVFVSTLPANAQAVSVSPNTSGLILTAVQFANNVHAYLLARDGSIIDTGREFYAGLLPNNVNFSRDGSFAFISNNAGGGVSVLSTARPDQISLIASAGTTTSQSMAVSRDGRRLFVLGPSLVSIYAFDPVSGALLLERSFTHGLSIASFYGVDQIALDPSETRLFISANGQVGVFTTYGISLGTVQGASGPGGIKICSC